MARSNGPKVGTPLQAYLGTQGTWFLAFGLQTVMIPFVVQRVLELDSVALGLAQAAPTVPPLLLLVFGGVLAERVDRRKLLAILHALAVGPPLALGFAIATGTLTFPMLLLYGLSMGVLGAMMMPTRDAALNGVADAQGDLSIQRAVVLASLIQFLGQIGGFAIAAATERLGMGEAVAPLTFIQAGALALGGVAALLLPRLPASGNHSGEGVFRQVAGGFAIVWRAPLIRAMALAMVAVGVLVIGGGFLILLPSMVDAFYGGGLERLGIVYFTFWTGAAIATAALARIGQVRRPGRAFSFTFAVGGASLLIFALTPPFLAVLAVVAVWGASAGVGISMSRSIVQEAAPPEALARVLSIYQLGFMGGAPIGAVAMGWFVDQFGLRPGAVVLMLGVLACAVWIGLLSPVGRARAARRPKQPTTEAKAAPDPEPDTLPPEAASLPPDDKLETQSHG